MCRGQNPCNPLLFACQIYDIYVIKQILNGKMMHSRAIHGAMASPETSTIVLRCALQAMHICLSPKRWGIGIEIRSSVPWSWRDIHHGHHGHFHIKRKAKRKAFHFASSALQCLRCHLKHRLSYIHGRTQKARWNLPEPSGVRFVESSRMVGSANCSRTFRPGATFRPRCGSASTGTCPREVAENVRTTKENPFKGIPSGND